MYGYDNEFLSTSSTQSDVKCPTEQEALHYLLDGVNSQTCSGGGKFAASKVTKRSVHLCYTYELETCLERRSIQFQDELADASSLSGPSSVFVSDSFPAVASTELQQYTLADVWQLKVEQLLEETPRALVRRECPIGHPIKKADSSAEDYFRDQLLLRIPLRDTVHDVECEKCRGQPVVATGPSSLDTITSTTALTSSPPSTSSSAPIAADSSRSDTATGTTPATTMELTTCSNCNGTGHTIRYQELLIYRVVHRASVLHQPKELQFNLHSSPDTVDSDSDDEEARNAYQFSDADASTEIEGGKVVSESKGIPFEVMKRAISKCIFSQAADELIKPLQYYHVQVMNAVSMRLCSTAAQVFSRVCQTDLQLDSVPMSVQFNESPIAVTPSDADADAKEEHADLVLEPYRKLFSSVLTPSTAPPSNPLKSFTGKQLVQQRHRIFQTPIYEFLCEPKGGKSSDRFRFWLIGELYDLYAPKLQRSSCTLL